MKIKPLFILLILLFSSFTFPQPPVKADHTYSGALWGYVVGKPVQFYEKGDAGTGANVGGGSSYFFDEQGSNPSDNRAIFTYNSDFYITIHNASGINLWKSTDGDTWTFVKGLDTESNGYAIYYDEATDIVHIGTVRKGDGHLYYITYNVATDTLSAASDKHDTGASGSVTGIYYNGTYVYTVWTDTLHVYEIRSDNWATDVDITDGFNHNTLMASCIFFEIGAITYTYAIWLNGNSHIGNLVTDITPGSGEVVISIYSYSGPRLAYRPTDNEIRVFQGIYDGANPFQAPFDDYDVITKPRDWALGTWGATAEILSDITYGETLYAYYDSAWEAGKYTIAFGDKTTRNKVWVYSGDDAVWNLEESFTFGNGFTNLDGLLMGGEGISPPSTGSLTITDLSAGIGADNMYSKLKYYTFVAVVTTLANPNDTTNVTITAKDGADIYFKVSGTTLTGVPAWSIIFNSTIINIDAASCSWVVAGVTGTATFKIESEWDFPTIANLDLYLEAIGPGGSSGEDLMQNNYFDVVSTLVATMTASSTYVFLNTQVGISGYVYYEYDPADTALYVGMLSPPNAQFTNVQVWNTTNIAQDWTIVSGAYSVIFTPDLATGNKTYTLILNLVADFTDAAPVNNPFVIVYVTATPIIDWGVLGDLLNVPFSYFGITGGASSLFTFITNLGAYLIQSITMMWSFVSSMATMLINFSVFFFYWVGIMSTFIMNIVGLVIGILNGTASIGGTLAGTLTGLGNVWTLFGGTNLILFMPFVIFIVWLQSLDSREKTTGTNFISLAINDFQVIYGLINVLTNFAMFIYSTVTGVVFWAVS